MNQKKLFNFFNSNFNLTKSTQGWYRFNDRLDIDSIAKNDNSAAVNFSYNKVINHRNGYNSSIIDYLKLVYGLDYKQLQSKISTYEEIDYLIPELVTNNECDVTLPDGYHSFDQQVLLQGRVLEYLEKRKTNIKYIQSKGWGFCNNGDFFGRIIIPVVNKNRLVYYLGRSFIGNKALKYKNPNKTIVNIGKSELFYNQDALFMHDEVYLTEGVFDAICFFDQGIASFGWKLSKKQISLILESSVKVLNIVPDKGFYKKALKLSIQFFDSCIVRICNIDNMEGNDVDEVGVDILEFKTVTWDLLKKHI